MKRIFNLLLAACGLALVIHVIMTVGTERMNNSRWAWTEQGRISMKTLINRKADPFLYGGNPVNSALLLNFRDNEEPLTIDAVESWIYFDFEGRGEAVKTSWVGPGIGLLVTDSDGSGLITSGRQIFGNRMLDGDSRKLTGFEALAKLDDNGDGLIDQRDAGWSRLRVWLDKKPDGRVGQNELYRLEQLKIAALDLKSRPENKLMQTGNFWHSRSSFIYADGRRGPLDEVFLQQQAGLHRYADEPAISPEVAALAPDLRGRGLMRNFRVALMQSPELMDVYRRYRVADTRQEQLDLMDELLTAWAEAGGAATTLAERLGDRYDVSFNCLDGMDPAHLRSLQVMDAWVGSNFYRLPHELYPGQELAPGVEAAEDGGRGLKITCPDETWRQIASGYGKLSAFIYERLLRATRLKPYYDRLDLNTRADFSQVLALFDEEFARNPEKALTDLLEFRLDLDRDSVLFRPEPVLDGYIRAKAAQAYFTADQRYLYGYLPAAAKLDSGSDEETGEAGKK